MLKPFNEIESLGRYKLLHELGRGGMSVVYLANDTKLDRNVAIKCVNTADASSTRLVEGLRAEAKLLAQLNHPNIVQLYDVVEQDGTLGLVIEYVGGQTLTQRLKLNPDKATKLRWLAEIAEGLSEAHSRGIAHCDLKAENILITADNTAKVADFGIAKVKLDDYLIDDGLTRVDNVSGSYFSLSPEQASGLPVDSRTDLFSFAVLVFQTLTGQHPFGETGNKIGLLQRVINEPVKLDQTVQFELGPRLLELVTNLLNKNPDDRLYNANEAAELFKSELGLADNRANDDKTFDIPTQQPKPRHLFFNKWNSFGSRFGLIVAGFLVGIIALKLPSMVMQSENEVAYIGLDIAEISVSEEFNSSLIPLIKSTLQQSAEDSILTFSKTGLVDSKELNSTEGNYARKALIAGLNDIVVVTTDCMQQKCDIKLQRRTGDKMAVSDQISFPVAGNSLVGLKNAIATQLPRLFKQQYLSFGKNDNVDEGNYRRYLDIYTQSNSGTSDNEQHFLAVQALIDDSPQFTPAYSLLNRLGVYLYQNTGKSAYLDTVLTIFDDAPATIKKHRIVIRHRIKVLLKLERFSDAKRLYENLANDINDELFLSEIESSIAYSEDNYELLLKLDRQNATWRPSINNLYNLATSEFFFGNHQKAKEILTRVLELTPTDSYALDLKATVEMSLGNLLSAQNIYKSLLTTSQDSSVYSNYGLTLILSQAYPDAIAALKKAVELNPKASLHRLNLADAYYLSGQKERAKEEYELTKNLLELPTTAQEYSSLAQAQAQLGQYILAVKTLKTANKKFPNIAEIDYAASIINTLSGNYVAATVDVNDAINRGTASVWFSLDWFKPLCNYENFKNTTGAATEDLCKKQG